MPRGAHSSRGARLAVELLVIAIIYYLLARLGQLLAIPPGNVTPIWPAAGFALAVVLLRGYRIWPGIWLGSLLGNSWAVLDISGLAPAAGSATVAAAIATGATLQAIAGGWLITRLCRRAYPFDRVGGVVIFLLTAILSCAISPTMGVTALSAGGVISWTRYGYTWLTWYLGNGVGVIVLTPLILTWQRAERRRSGGGAAEAFLLALVTIFVSLMTFTGLSPFTVHHLPVAFLVAIPVLWAALRYGQIGAVAAVGLISAIAAAGTVAGYGAFWTGDQNQSLILVQLFSAHTMIAALLLTAALAQYDEVHGALRFSEKRFRSVIQSAPIGIAVTHPDGRVAQANPAFLKMVGYSQDELTDLTFLDITHPDDIVASRNLVHQAIQQRHTGMQLEKRYQRKDGSTVWSNTVVAPAYDEDGKLEFLVAMADDITQRKQVEAQLNESRDRYGDLFENSREMIQSVAPDGSINYVNDAWKKTLGYSDREIEWLNIFEVIHPEDVPSCRLQFDRVMKGESLDKVTARFLAKGGREIFVEGSSSCRFEDGRPVATRGIFRDVTQRRQDERKLIRYAAELERSNKDLQDFAHVVSHDLQEPLRAVSGFCTLLASKYQGKLDADADEFIHFIVDGAGRMQRLIKDLLVYSRVESRGGKFEVIDLNVVLQDALDNLRAQIEESDARVISERLPTVRADVTQMVQLFQNLIGNAIKYRSERRPEIRITAYAEVSDWVLSFQDNGIGIPPSQTERIFVVFQRLHARNDYPGTGIGLAVCKRIVERHQGRIWCDSNENEGSTFHFTIPIALLSEETGDAVPLLHDGNGAER